MADLRAIYLLYMEEYMNKNILVILILLLLLSSCGGASVDDGSASGQNNREVTQENVDGGERSAAFTFNFGSFITNYLANLMASIEAITNSIEENRLISSIEGEAISSAAGANTYDVNIGAMETSFSMSASIAQGASVDFILHGETFHTTSNSSQERKTVSVTFPTDRVDVIRGKAKIVASSSNGDHIETIRFNIIRNLGLNALSVADDIFDVEALDNSFAINNLAYEGDRIIVGIPSDSRGHNSTLAGPDIRTNDSSRGRNNAFYSGAARIFVKNDEEWELGKLHKSKSRYNRGKR